jgi:hypothetical protein
MTLYGRLLAPILVVALAGCGSGGGAMPATPTTTDEATSAADQYVKPRPAPVAPGTLAYLLDGSVHVADPDGSNAVRILNGSCASTEGFSYWAEGSLWSPDGRYLVFRAFDCPDGGSKSTGEDWGDAVISDAAGNVLAMFPADGWDIGWSPDSSRIAVWDNLFETVGVYGVDGTRRAQIEMPPGWTPSGDHDPAWLQDGTLAVDNLELPLDGSSTGWLQGTLAAEWRDGYAAEIGRVDSPDGSHTAYVDGRSLLIDGSDGSGSVKLLRVERGRDLRGVIGFSPEGDRILFATAKSNNRGAIVKRQLWSVGVDGSDPRLVVAGTFTGDWSL